MKPSWITTNIAGAEGNNLVNITAKVNDTNFTPRSGIVTVASTDISKTINCEQEGLSYYTITDHSPMVNSLVGAKIKTTGKFRLQVKSNDISTPLYCDFGENIKSIVANDKFYIAPITPKRIYMVNNDYTGDNKWNTDFTYESVDKTRTGTGTIEFNVTFDRSNAAISEVTSLRTLQSCSPELDVPFSSSVQDVVIKLGALNNPSATLEGITIEFKHGNILPFEARTVTDTQGLKWTITSNTHILGFTTSRTETARAASLRTSITITDGYMDRTLHIQLILE